MGIPFKQSTEKTYNFSGTLQLSAYDTVGQVYATQSSRFYTGLDYLHYGGYRVK